MALLRLSAGGIFRWRPAVRDVAASPRKDDRDAGNDVAAQGVQSRPATAVDVGVLPEGAERERPLAYFRAAAVQQKARRIVRESVSRVAGWRSSERSRQVAWDVVDACGSHLLGDLPRNSIIPRVFYSTLKREAKNWWQHQQQQKKQQQQREAPVAAQNGKVDGASVKLPGGGGGDMAGELKGLLLEMDQLRAEVRELRREVGQMRTKMGETKLPEELPVPGLAAADPDGSPQPPAVEWENLLAKVASEVSGMVMPLPPPGSEVADTMEKLRFWKAKREEEQVGSSEETGKT